MHATADVTEERTFQMDAERLGSLPTGAVVSRRTLNRIRQPVEGGPGLVERGGHGGRKITGHAMFEKQLLNRA